MYTIYDSYKKQFIKINNNYFYSIEQIQEEYKKYKSLGTCLILKCEVI